MELNDVMRTTFSARDYTGEPLPDEALHEILENARFAPSGGNRQGVRVIAVRDQGLRDRLRDLAEPAAKRYVAQIAAGESPWNARTPTRVTDDDIERAVAAPSLVKPFGTASVVLVFVVDLGVVAATDQILDRVGIIGGASIYPLVWNILLSARQLGFGGTISTMAVAEEPRVQALLNIPSHYAVCAVVPLGRPVKQLTKLRRRAVAEFVTRERFDGEAFVFP